MNLLFIIGNINTAVIEEIKAVIINVRNCPNEPGRYVFWRKRKSISEPTVPQTITQADTYETPTNVFLFIAFKEIKQVHGINII